MNTSIKRLIGAQFRKNLNGEILIFRYPTRATRMFHTMWCAPLRIVVLESDSSDARVLYDKIVEPWRFVLLPAGELVLEMDPGTDYAPALQEITKTSRKAPKITQDLPIGGIDSSISVTRMLFEMFAAALSDLRSVKSTCMDEKGLLDPRKLAIQYEPWERGQILASAGFVLDFSPDRSWTLPRGVIPLSFDLVKYEKEYAEELLAASHSAAPYWRTDLKAVCLGCGGGGSWRPILATDPSIPVEISWRLLRPENNFPLCNRCAERFKVAKKANIRHELGGAFWGVRYTALERWYQGLLSDDEHLPHDWDKTTHPLWPASYGGNTWETGSGAIQFVEPQWPTSVQRSHSQIEFLKHAGVYDVVVNYPVKK
jgi:hypothetical protein